MREFFAAILAVLSAFVGIRKRGAALADQGIKPQHIVVAAILCLAMLVVSIVSLVQLIVR
jgi:Protein of unknown function (DUF2970)